MYAKISGISGHLYGGVYQVSDGRDPRYMFVEDGSSDWSIGDSPSVPGKFIHSGKATNDPSSDSAGVSVRYEEEKSHTGCFFFFTGPPPRITGRPKKNFLQNFSVEYIKTLI